MFKRSNSKASIASGDKKSPQIRPQYMNAAIRAAASSGSPRHGTVAHTSVLEISDAHTKILEEISAVGKIPSTGAGSSWEYVRDEVCRPLIEHLLDVSVQCRSDVLLPNGRWIGAGNPPNADGTVDGVSNGSGLGERTSSSSQPGHGGTPKTAPSTPVDSIISGGGGAKKKIGSGKGNGHDSSDDNSDNDNAAINNNNNSFRRNNTESGTSNASGAGVDVMPSVLEKADFETENEYIVDQWCSLPGPTFTLQRLAEILLQHRRYHCYSTEHPFGAAAIALGGATSEVIGIGSVQHPSRSATPTRRAESEASAAALPPRSPRSVGTMRGEKLQAAIRRCILVASLENLN